MLAFRTVPQFPSSRYRVNHMETKDQCFQGWPGFEHYVSTSTPHRINRDETPLQAKIMDRDIGWSFEAPYLRIKLSKDLRFFLLVETYGDRHVVESGDAVSKGGFL